MTQLTVDFSKRTGSRIKPMHGVGQPPFWGLDFSMFHYLSEAGIPFSRLHDVGGAFGGSRFVDIPNLFPNFDADPTDPANYDFAFTDRLICALMEHHCEPFFRLGVTIETSAEVKAYRIYPPKDNLQWAKICEGIIAHYTEGWANGFRFPIRYWEIWNEPDNEEDPMTNRLWRGTAEEFFELYTVASKYLKSRFPQLKIGGYGSCGFYSLKNTYIPEANSSPRYDYFITFFDKFLQHILKHNAPLDFFSWHNYDNGEHGALYAQYVRERLDEAGFTDTETTCNEWNYAAYTRGTASHAALTAAQILAFENSPLDSAMFYDARVGVSKFGSLFHPLTREPLKAYYGFVDFNRLYQLREKVNLETELPSGIHAVAATDGKHGAVMLTNHNEQAVPLTVQTLTAPIHSYLTDDQHTHDLINFDNMLPPFSIVLLEYEW